jgi:hypothetical protein
LGALGIQETFCIVIAGLLERDSFDLLLPEFDKPWVIPLRETCCCSTNLCTWRPNTVYIINNIVRIINSVVRIITYSSVCIINSVVRIITCKERAELETYRNNESLIEHRH